MALMSATQERTIPPPGVDERVDRPLPRNMRRNEQPLPPCGNAVEN
jgi:hypothetical protein